MIHKTKFVRQLSCYIRASTLYVHAWEKMYHIRSRVLLKRAKCMPCFPRLTPVQFLKLAYNSCLWYILLGFLVRWNHRNALYAESNCGTKHYNCQTLSSAKPKNWRTTLIPRSKQHNIDFRNLLLKKLWSCPTKNSKLHFQDSGQKLICLKTFFLC